MFEALHCNSDSFGVVVTRSMQ